VSDALVLISPNLKGIEAAGPTDRRLGSLRGQLAAGGIEALPSAPLCGPKEIVHGFGRTKNRGDIGLKHNRHGFLGEPLCKTVRLCL
jgi:hypothetical protein